MEGKVSQAQAELEERVDAMKQMQEQLLKKGEENQRLSETVNQIKNQILEEQIFDQKFIVQQQGTLTITDYIFQFVRDSSEDGEFFLEISTSGQGQGTRTRKRISVVDIEAIEPIQGIKFKLVYHAKKSIYDQLSFKRDGLKTELYSSRHLAQLMDGLQ